MLYRSFLPLSLLCLAPFAIAAPLQVSGSASGILYTEYCYDSFSTPNQSATCQGFGYGSTASHTGTQISGAAEARAYGEIVAIPGPTGIPDFYSGAAFAQVEVHIQNDFVLTGGVGTATLEFGQDAYWGGVFTSCGFSVMGTTYVGCTPPTDVFNVAFGTPIPITLHLVIDLYGGTDGENVSYGIYNLQDIVVKQDGQRVEGAAFTPVPEPASMLTLGLGLLAVGSLHQFRKSIAKR